MFGGYTVLFICANCEFMNAWERSFQGGALILHMWTSHFFRSSRLLLYMGNGSLVCYVGDTEHGHSVRLYFANIVLLFEISM